MPTTTTSAPATTDRIEEQVQLPATRARVWRALTTADELGAWFGADLTGATIAPGAHVIGRFTIPGHEHMTFDVIIDKVDAEHRFAWRWHPHPSDGADVAAEPRTLVTFTLVDTAAGGTLLRVVESGFEGVAAARRSAALLGNSKGWEWQLHERLTAYFAADSRAII